MKKILIILSIILFFTLEAEGGRKYVKIELRSGEIIEGHLIERTNTYIKIDRFGSESTYSQNDIKGVSTHFKDCVEKKEATLLLTEAQDKDTDEGVRLYRAIYEKYPFDCAAQYAQREIINLLTRLGRLEEAFSECDKYIKKYPDAEDAASWLLWKADVLRSLGYNKKQAGQHEKSVAFCKESLNAYKQLISDYPNNSLIEDARWYTLEVEFEHLKTVSGEEAVARFKEFYPASKRHCADALWAIAKIYDEQLKNYSTAVIYYQDYINRYPQGESTARLEIGDCFNRLGDLDKAFIAWEECVTEKSVRGRYASEALMNFAFMGERFEQQNNYQGALKAFNKFIELSPKRADCFAQGYDRFIMRKIADIYLQQKDYKQAINILLKSLSDPVSYLEGGFGQDGRQIRYTIDASEILSLLADAYERSGDASKADKMKRQSENLKKNMDAIRQAIENQHIGSRAKVEIGSIKVGSVKAEVEYGLFYPGVIGEGCGAGFKVFLMRSPFGWSIIRKERTWVS